MGEKAIVIRINGDVKDFESKLKKIDAETKDFSNALGKSAAISGAAFVGLSAAIGYTISAYKEGLVEEQKAAQLISQTGREAEISAQSMINFATSLASVTNAEDTAILAASNLLLTFKNISSKSIPEITTVALDLATVMGTDVTDAAKTLGKALDSPKEGLGALSKAGVRFTEDQKKAFASLVDQGRIAEAQSYILAAVASRVGGAAKAIADPVTIARKELGEFAEDIGKKLSPILDSAARNVTAFTAAIRSSDAFVGFISKSLLAGAAIAGIITAASAAALAFIKLKTVIAAAGGVAAIASAPVFLIAAGIAAVTAAFVFFGAEITGALKATWAFISNYFGQFGQLLEGFSKILSSAFAFDSDKLKEGLAQVRDVIKKSAMEAGKAWSSSFDESQTKPELNQGLIDASKATDDQINIDKEAALSKRMDLAKRHAESMQAIRDESDYLDKNKDLVLAEDRAKFDLEQKQKKLTAEQDFNQQLAAVKNDSSILDDTFEVQYSIAKANRELEEKRTRLTEEKEYGKNLAAIRAQFRNKDFQNMEQSLGAVAGLQRSSNRTLFEIGKAAAIANATINIAQGVTQAWALGPILGPVMAALVAAAGIVQIGEISGTTLQAAKGFSGGGRAFGERYMSTFTPREITIPENFSEGIKKGKYSLTSSGEKSQESGSMGGELILSLKDNLVDFIEAQLIERQRLGISRG